MSADAWQICPQCFENRRIKRIRDIEALNEDYGEVPIEEWLGMKTALEGVTSLEETLREDYEIGTEESGKFYVSYAAHCSACGFQHSFKHEEQLEVAK